jgi:hypothetical protein
MSAKEPCVTYIESGLEEITENGCRYGRLKVDRNGISHEFTIPLDKDRLDNGINYKHYNDRPLEEKALVWGSCWKEGNELAYIDIYVPHYRCLFRFLSRINGVFTGFLLDYNALLDDDTEDMLQLKGFEQFYGVAHEVFKDSYPELCKMLYYDRDNLADALSRMQKLLNEAMKCKTSIEEANEAGYEIVRYPNIWKLRDICIEIAVMSYALEAATHHMSPKHS